MAHFSITSTRATIEKIEEFFKSLVLTMNRSMKLGGTYHEEGYSCAVIKSVEEEEKIRPEDIFWLGFYTGVESQKFEEIE